MATYEILALSGAGASQPNPTRIGVSDTVSVPGAISVTGQATFSGTSSFASVTDFAVADPDISLGLGYTSTTNEPGGFTITVAAVATASTQSVSSVPSSTTVGVSDHTQYAANDIVQLSGMNTASNNGYVRVASVATNTITINTSPGDGFFLSSLTADAVAAGTASTSRVARLRQVAGVWGSAYGSTAPLTYTAFSSNASSFLQGGNSFGAAGLLGLTDDYSLQLLTNGATRWSIANASGIGALTSSATGSAATPVFTLANDATTGLYQPAVGGIGVTAAGTNVATFNASGVSATTRFLSGSGAVSAPDFSTTVDSDTGIYFPAANTVGIAGNGSAIATFGASVSVFASTQLSVPPGTAGAPGIGFTGDLDTGISATAANTLVLSAGGSAVATFTGLATVLASTQLSNTAGTAGVPSYSVTGDLDTGLYFPSANTVGIAGNGAAIATFGASASVLASAQVSNALGTATVPSYSFTGDLDTGISAAAANTLVLSAGGTAIATLTSSLTTLASTQVVVPAGTASLPGVTFAGDTDTGILHPAVNSVSIACNAATVVAVTTAGSDTAGTILNNGHTIGTILTWGNNSQANTTTTKFMDPGWVTAAAGTVEILVPVTRAGTVRGMFIAQTVGNVTQAIVYTVRKNSVDTALAVTIANNVASGSNVANSFTVVAGDKLSVKSVMSSAPGNTRATNIVISIELV